MNAHDATQTAATSFNEIVNCSRVCSCLLLSALVLVPSSCVRVHLRSSPCAMGQCVNLERIPVCLCPCLRPVFVSLSASLSACFLLIPWESVALPALVSFVMQSYTIMASCRKIPSNNRMMGRACCASSIR